MKINKRKLNIYIVKDSRTLKEIAVNAEIDVVTLGRILSGKQQPRRSTIGRIAKALNVDVTDILED